MKKYCSGMRSLAHRYDRYLLDLWGVVHDGERAYPWALACLRKLYAGGKKIVFISNSSGGSESTVAELRELGIDDHLYSRVITGGQVAADWLAKKVRDHCLPRDLGPAYFHFGPDDRAGLLDHIAFFDRVKAVKRADFLLVTGVDPVLDEDEVLTGACQHGLPMVCANPDIFIARLDGRTMRCAGYFAKRYQDDFSGNVYFFGKPYRAIYEAAMTGCPDAGLALAVGDSLETDIAGANAAGIDALLIMQGVANTRVKNQERGSNERLTEFARICEWSNLQSPAFMEDFKW